MEQQQNKTVTIHSIQNAEPPLYSVLFLNDAETPMDFVVMLLEKYFHLKIDEAVDIMFQVHDNGSSYVGAYPLDIAETLYHRCWSEISKSDYPLKIQTIPLS